MDNSIIKKAEVLIEALPYIREFAGKLIVIKYGGKAMLEASLKESTIVDIVLMKFVGMNPIVVHGGGVEISEMMEKLGKKPKFIDGLRITDKETVEIVEMVLVGKINKEIVKTINKHGGKAVGLSGKDGNLIIAEKKKSKNGIDLGFVGRIKTVNPDIINTLYKKDFIPVISPIAVNESGETLNINADEVAGELSKILKADKLIYLTDVDGIIDRNKRLISTLNISKISKLIEKKIIASGMIPKVKSCADVIKSGVGKVHIVNGTIKHALLLEIFTKKGIGTEIVK